jgi:hypothetical protein
MFSKKKFVEKLWESSQDTVIELPIELQKAIEKSGKGELEAIDISEEVLPSVKRMIRQKIFDCENKKITPNFRFSEQSENRLIGTLKTEKKEHMKGKLQYRKELQEFISHLNWKTFENLCLYIMQLCKFEKYNLGKRTADGGMDFFGVYRLLGYEEYRGFLTKMTFRIFGQAKHRDKNPVKGAEVRSFHTHYLDFLIARGKAYDYVSSNCAWFLEENGPLIPLFVTNGRFAKGAVDFAEKNGIILREGAQVVEDIVQLSKDETWLVFKAGKYSFAPERFRNYLNLLSSGTTSH